MFSGETTAIAGSARMSMRIEIQEVGAGEMLFHTISAPGLGVGARPIPREELQVPQADHESGGARVLPRGRALPLAEETSYTYLTQALMVAPEERQLLNFILDFKSGELAKLAMKLNGEEIPLGVDDERSS